MDIFTFDEQGSQRIVEAVRWVERFRNRRVPYRRQAPVIRDSSTSALVQVDNTTPQSLSPSSTDNIITFDEEISDPYDEHSLSSNTGRITIAVSRKGVFNVAWSATMGAVSTDNSQFTVKIRENGSTILNSHVVRMRTSGSATASADGDCYFEKNTEANVGDYYEVLVTNSDPSNSISFSATFTLRDYP